MVSFPASQLAFGIAQEIGGRAYQEDAAVALVDFNALLDKNTSLDLNVPRAFFAVYDGHGGSGCVKFVERMLHVKLASALETADTVEQAFEAAFLEVESLWMEQATRRDSLDLSGTTANCVLIVGTKVYCANAGDTRTVLFRNDNDHVELSTDHKPNRSSERERIESVGGEVKAKQAIKKSWFLGKTKKVEKGPKRCYPGGLAVARSFGDIRSKIEEFGGREGVVIARPDVTCTDISEGTRFLTIGSDGLWDNVSEYRTLNKALDKSFRRSNSQIMKNPLIANVDRRNDICALNMAQVAVDFSFEECGDARNADNTTAIVILLPDALEGKPEL